MDPKFLIIPDSFKDCLPADEVGESIVKGIKQVFPKSAIKVIPIADGGEGTVHSIISALGGEIIHTKVKDPLHRTIDSFYGILPDKSTAIIEMAAASGLERLTKNERNPLLTSSFGTGELILDALNKGCKKIIIGIGGSATNDGGVGMAMALGLQFIDKQHNKISLGASYLNEISSIDIIKIDHRITETAIIVACDVSNKLCGAQGASVVYGPQKGATPAMVQQLDSSLKHLAALVKRDLAINIENLNGGGAAGGLGAGLTAFCGAKIKPGFESISELLNLEKEITNADIIITAEGSVDSQTLYGKTPAGVGSLAKKYNKPLFVFTGAATEEIEKLDTLGVSSLIPITRYPVDLSTAILNASHWLTLSAHELCKTIMVGKSIS
ncbi:MAG: glycerate kinase [Salinivirgaceae bacterium]|nr:glycerate kinase [Salinivirgaceae bacterium]